MVRIQVDLDVYSGKVNPTWELAEDKVKEFFEIKGWKDLILPEENEHQLRLGYRGFILSVISNKTEKRDSTLSENFAEQRDIVLPNTFRIYSSKKQEPGIKHSLDLEEIQDKERWLLDTSKESIMRGMEDDMKVSSGGLSNELMQYVEKSISQKMPEDSQSQEHMDSSEQKSPSEDQIAQTYSPQFWNNPAWVKLNNCYNYASNRRTNTFAQPGKAHGCTFRFDCPSVRDAAFCDGVKANNIGQNYLVALVIWPGQDYHWYTAHANQGFWGHKPGQTTVRNWDDSGRILSWKDNLTPYNCNRGPYTQFCGFYYIPGDIVIV
jgi:hypothetical protein